MEVNTLLLEKKIKDIGLKIGTLCKRMGISRTSFYNKLNNKVSFKVSEVFMLCSILNITDEEKPTFFYPKKV